MNSGTWELIRAQQSLSVESLSAIFKGVIMKLLLHILVATLAVLSATLNTNTQAQTRVVIEDRFTSVKDVRLHYLAAGKGEPVILLHGYAQNSRMWRPLIVELALV
jgi:hypothetical protein